MDPGCRLKVDGQWVQPVFFSRNIFPWGIKKLMLEKKPGINVKLHLVLGLLLLPGRNEKIIVPMLGIPVEMS